MDCYCNNNKLTRIGGPGKVVELDESHLSTKAKYRRGRKVGTEQFWAFGGRVEVIRNLPGMGRKKAPSNT